jgi:hypothetical protein
MSSQALQPGAAVTGTAAKKLETRARMSFSSTFNFLQIFLTLAALKI